MQSYYYPYNDPLSFYLYSHAAGRHPLVDVQTRTKSRPAIFRPALSRPTLFRPALSRPTSSNDYNEDFDTLAADLERQYRGKS